MQIKTITKSFWTVTTHLVTAFRRQQCKLLIGQTPSMLSLSHFRLSLSTSLACITHNRPTILYSASMHKLFSRTILVVVAWRAGAPNTFTIRNVYKLFTKQFTATILPWSVGEGVVERRGCSSFATAAE